MKEKTINTKNIYKGRVVELNLVKVKLPDGNTSTREIIRHPGASAVIPVLPNNKVVMVEQYRKPVEEVILEIPAGTLSGNESPLTCAKRELTEETGYKARYFKKLITIYPTPGYSNEKIHIYKATGLIKTKGIPDSDEFLKTVIVPIRKIRNLVKQGKIKDTKTLVGLSYLI